MAGIGIDNGTNGDIKACNAYESARQNRCHCEKRLPPFFSPGIETGTLVI